MVRRVKEKDREEFIRLSELFYNSPAVLHTVPRAYHENLFDELMRSDTYAEAFMLEQQGETIGYALTSKTYSREAGGKVLWLEEIFVEDEYRGCGIGKEFFMFIEGYASFNGFARIRLEVENENKRARSLYERLGYEYLDYLQMVKEYRKI